jgi:hypothetical protein
LQSLVGDLDLQAVPVNVGDDPDELAGRLAQLLGLA